MKKVIVLFVLFLAGISWGCTSTIQEEDLEHWKRSTWQMKMNLETRNLKPPALQWTVFDKDPVPVFHARLEKMKGYYLKRLEGAEDDADKELNRSTQMTVSWDLGFEEVTGDKVYLLTRAHKVSHSFSSNAPDGKKWIVTKTVQIKGKPVCWCIPVTVETGTEIHIAFTNDNMFELKSEFNKVMREDE